MAGNKTRKNKKNGKSKLSITRRVFSPVGHALNAAGTSVKVIAKTAGNMVQTGLRGVRKIGNSVASHIDAAIKNVTSGKGSASKKRK
jgi:hypothetical protein